MEILELAKKFNAVETVCVENERRYRCERQPYNVLFVLDFEATCWNQNDSFKGAPEIIEFPCVLYDVRSKKCLSEFQQYVMPIEKPRLSSFCTSLTGIQQQQVNSGMPIGTCLMIFKKWLKEKEITYNISFNSQDCVNRSIFCTWSNWDLGICLKNECKRKRISVPDIFKAWIDLRELYQEHYLRRPKGLYGALQELGMDFEGRQHCGLDDARNTAKLAGRMITDGVLLKKTTELL